MHPSVMQKLWNKGLDETSVLIIGVRIVAKCEQMFPTRSLSCLPSTCVSIQIRRKLHVSANGWMSLVCYASMHVRWWPANKKLTWTWVSGMMVASYRWTILIVTVSPCRPWQSIETFLRRTNPVRAQGDKWVSEDQSVWIQCSREEDLQGLWYGKASSMNLPETEYRA